MKKKRFEKPEMEQVMFEAEDVIVTSSGCSGDCVKVCVSDCIEVCSGVCHIVS